MTEITNSSDTNVCTDGKMEEDNTNNSNVVNTHAEEDTSKHPYHLQLAEFQPNAWQLEERYPQMYLSLEETKLTMVDSQELLDEMMTKLKQVKEIAIALEDHNYHSFIGFVCLIQISTRTEDFIVDAIKLKEEITVLNEVCTDPNILKVLHNGHPNTVQLQRDFSIYIVNMFDTLEAATNYSQKLSLAHIVKEICDVEIDKHYHLADWRVRPLPSDMINHARQGTHYLLYICDVYTNKCLLGAVLKTLLKTVYEKGTKLCGLLHKPRVFTEDQYKKNFRHERIGTLTPQQFECYRVLYKWRFHIAQEQDESTGYTLPNKMLFEISKLLPSNVEDITACYKTLPPLLEQNITNVLALVKNAIDFVPEPTVVVNTEKRKVPSRRSLKKIYCFRCRKSGRHMTKDCDQINIDPYGIPPLGRSGVFGGNFGKLLENKLKELAFCFACGKPGHWIQDCHHNRAETAVGPSSNPLGGPRGGGFVGGYGNPHGDFHRGAYGGGYGNPRGDLHRGAYGGGNGNPRGDLHRGAYGGGYGSRGFHPIPPPYSDEGYDRFHWSKSTSKI